MAQPARLAEVLVAHWRHPGAAAAASDPQVLELELRRVLAAARATWPGVSLDAEIFVRYLAARLPPRRDAVGALARLCTADLYLACACAQGDPQALAAFERCLLPQVAPALARAGATETLVDEVKQVVRVRLLAAAAGTPPRIVDYAGTGPLGRWLQITAVRQASNLRRRRKTDGEPASEAALERHAPGVDPEIEYLKGRYAAEFRDAFRRALVTLSSRERNLLKLHFMDGLGIGQVATLYRVHRVTVARWLGQARESLLRETRRLLGVQLGVAPDELDSVLRFVRSRMQVTLQSVLAEIPGVVRD